MHYASLLINPPLLRFERNGREVDEELRSAFYLPPLLKNLNDDQTRVVQRCLALETGSASVEWTPLKSTSPFVSMSMKYTAEEGIESR